MKLNQCLEGRGFLAAFECSRVEAIKWTTAERVVMGQNLKPKHILDGNGVEPLYSVSACLPVGIYIYGM